MVSIVDRQDELAALEQAYKRDNSFIVVYGRRRIGKTRLLKEFTKDKEGIYYVFEDASREVQLQGFKTALGTYLHDRYLEEQHMESWKALFTYLSKTVDKRRKFHIWLDEFSYALRNDKTLASALQEFLDHTVRESCIHLIVSGSLFGVMSESILVERSPLYGRRTKDLLIREIPFPYVGKFLTGMDFNNILKTYLCCGSVPEYLIVAKEYEDVQSLLKKEFLHKNGYFYRELTFLLASEFKEIRIYFSILNAISYGHTRISEIGPFVGIEGKATYPYLEALMQYGFVTKEVPIDRPKEGIYLLKDPFIDSWFTFVHKQNISIEREVATLDKEEFHRFLGKRFEIFVREHFHHFVKKEFSFIGKWWYKDVEVDLYAKAAETVYIGESKFIENVNPLALCEHLRSKVVHILPAKKSAVELILFAKSFTKKITAYQEYLVHCFDETDIRKILK